MGDKVIHALAWDDQVRVVAASMTETVQKAVRVHESEATASAVIGRALIGARLLQASVKDTERVTLQIRGFGPVGLVVARAEPSGDVYGSIQDPSVHLPPREDGKLDVGMAVGWVGDMTVVRDTSKHADPYVGVTELVSGEIGDDIAHYLATSEQIHSAVALGVMMGPDGEVRGAGGVLVQILGGLDDETVELLEARVKALSNISERMTDGATAEDLLQMVCGAEARVLEENPAAYRCDRDRSYYADRLATLNAAALEEIFEDDPSIELTCEFTREVYTFAREDFAALGAAR